MSAAGVALLVGTHEPSSTLQAVLFSGQEVAGEELLEKA